MHWILLGICGSFLALTVFVVQGIAQDQARDVMIKTGLVSFSLELLGLSFAYIWLLWWLARTWYKQYHLLLAMVVSLSGCLSAIIPSFMSWIYQVRWDLALWVSNLLRHFNRHHLIKGRCTLPWLLYFFSEL